MEKASNKWVPPPPNYRFHRPYDLKSYITIPPSVAAAESISTSCIII